MDEAVTVAVFGDVGVVVEEVAVARVEIVDEVGLASVGGVVVGAGVEEFVGVWVLKRDEVVIEGDAVAGVVDELLVEVEAGFVVEDEMGFAEEVQTLVDWLHQVVALLWGICFLWVVKGAMQPRLHLGGTLGEAGRPDFGPGRMGSSGEQTQPVELLVPCPFLCSPKGFHWCPNLPRLGCEPQVLGWPALVWATSEGGETHLAIRQPALPWGLDQGRG